MKIQPGEILVFPQREVKFHLPSLVVKDFENDEGQKNAYQEL